MLCLNCNNEFSPRTRNHRYCSTKCCNQAFHKRHPDRQSKYAHKSRMKVAVYCKVCKNPIPIENRKMGVVFCSNVCRTSQKRENAKKYQLAKKQSVEQYKLSRGCCRCHYKVCAAALDFHHLKPAEKMCGLKQSSWSPTSKRVQAELKKCIILCKNCHYELHHGIPFEGNALQRTR